MKHLYLVVFLFALNSLGQAENIEVENILFDCLIHSYADAKVDLSKELDKLEVYLIENEFLASSSGQAYYDFYKKVGETNLIPSRLDYDQFEGIYKLAPNEFYSEECLEHLKKLDSTIVSTSKYFQMKVAMNEVSAGNIGPGKIAKVITSVLRPADFDSPYYRAIALLTIAYTSDSDKGFSFKE